MFWPSLWGAWLIRHETMQISFEYVKLLGGRGFFKNGVFSVRRLLLPILSVLALGVPFVAFAQVIEEGRGCDRNFLTAMNNAAWMAGQSEVEAAETLILKSDSVLQFTCLNNIASNGTVVGAAMPGYISSNFAKAGTSAGNLCAGMAGVWRAMKCDDFDIADFRSYQELADDDPRQFYDPCDSSARDTEWTNAMTAAYPPPATPPAAVGMDAVQSNVGLMWAGDCAAGAPRPTGRTAYDSITDTRYPDAVCPVPGCMYDHTANECVPAPAASVPP
jgi:hypothetical protein